MTCRDHDVLLSLRAAGALEPAEAARLDAHLAGCAACRAEADDLAAALELAALPPPSDAERRALQGLPERTLAAWRRQTRVRAAGKRVAAVFAAVAAAAAVLLAPAVLHRGPRTPVSEAAAGWEQPDLDAIWSDSDVLDLDASAASDAADLGAADQDDVEADALVAALDL